MGLSTVLRYLNFDQVLESNFQKIIKLIWSKLMLDLLELLSALIGFIIDNFLLRFVLRPGSLLFFFYI